MYSYVYVRTHIFMCIKIQHEHGTLLWTRKRKLTKETSIGGGRIQGKDYEEEGSSRGSAGVENSSMIQHTR